MCVSAAVKSISYHAYDMSNSSKYSVLAYSIHTCSLGQLTQKEHLCSSEVSVLLKDVWVYT